MAFSSKHITNISNRLNLSLSNVLESYLLELIIMLSWDCWKIDLCSMSFHMKDEICFSRLHLREKAEIESHIMMEKVCFLFFQKKYQKED